MATKEMVIQSLQNFIIERENSNKKRIYEKSENNEFDLSLTQFHIIEVIDKNKKVNNKLLSEELNISAPGISKAIKKLVSSELVDESYLKDNKKERYYSLTPMGQKYAHVHEELHQRAVNKYNEILSHYTNDQLDTIVDFLDSMTKSLKE
ncbi:MarR family winged helix-turn-helix transcriptional regulator [Rummeliibacillus suwonensis]|uniref:MarR family winged helix-turn-helix transcriptional regulator n=1 Tax=Rummeliibacillus suwonensis TaxID=1306154 RepID=UPI0011B726F6|nr:winged helix-turn-helix transcriptional regulator [Rummeliibacillus suwonensis]